MFQNVNINFTSKDVKEVFAAFDKDNKSQRSNFPINTEDALNFKEYKECALDPLAEQRYSKIMRRIRDEIQKKGAIPFKMVSANKVMGNELESSLNKWRQSKLRHTQIPKFIPMTFQSMMTFLCYTTMRDKLHQDVFNERLDLTTKMKSMLKLLQLGNAGRQTHFKYQKVKKPKEREKDLEKKEAKAIRPTLTSK